MTAQHIMSGLLLFSFESLTLFLFIILFFVLVSVFKMISYANVSFLQIKFCFWACIPPFSWFQPQRVLSFLTEWCRGFVSSLNDGRLSLHDDHWRRNSLNMTTACATDWYLTSQSMSPLGPTAWLDLVTGIWSHAIPSTSGMKHPMTG
jgi:hypothetical protein